MNDSAAGPLGVVLQHYLSQEKTFGRFSAFSAFWLLIAFHAWISVIKSLYSEQKSRVKRELFGPLEAKTEVHRFGPNMDTSRGLCYSASQVLNNLHDSWASQIDSVRSLWDATVAATGQRKTAFFKGAHDDLFTPMLSARM